jgi:hypothetical protein
VGFGAFVKDVLLRLGLSISYAFEWTGYTIDDTDMTLNRMTFTDKSTIGELWIDGKFFCYTLEDTCRDHKMAGKTAIPNGRYQVTIDHSEKFNRDMPHLLNVPHFEGVRIHWGNRPEDTDGCILVGKSKDVDFIMGSRMTFDILFPIIQDKLVKGPLFLSVLGGIRSV